MALHSELAPGSIHVPYNYSYANSTARLAATGFVPGDVGKLALQESDSSLWILTDDSPITWVAVGGGGGGFSLTIDDGITSVVDVDTIIFSGAVVTDDGGGQATVTISGGAAYTTPPSTGWTWANQGSAAAAMVGDTLVLTDPAAGSTSANNHVYYRTAPSPPYSLIVALQPMQPGINFSGAGVGWRQNSNGKLIFVRLQFNSVFNLNVTTADDPTTEVANVVSAPAPLPYGPLWLKLEDDNTNRKAYFSMDGQTWVQIYTQGRTSFLTADQLCIDIDSRNTTYGSAIAVLSWDV